MDGLRLVLAGAAIGNGNRGVEALGRSVADAVDRDAPNSRISVLDDGWGVRADHSGRYPNTMIEMVGVRQSRRWHRPESWAQIRAAQRLAPRLNPTASRIKAAAAVLDLSGGDSFTDLYGPARLKKIIAPKEAALRAHRPLVLLPQTYGPFVGAVARHRAAQIIRTAALAYARDPDSYQRLLELAGPDHDAARLRNGVDVAFALEPRQPDAEVTDVLDGLAGKATAGVNVSGLLLDNQARTRFGLTGNYLDTMTQLVITLIDAGAHVVLVPHVHLPGAVGESDIRAITQVLGRLSAAQRARTSVLPTRLDAAELKWCIAQLDWFVGSRMHAAIAALSTMVPAVGYAYSDKTRGVFETCGMADQVLDARSCTGSDAIQQMLEAYLDRRRIRLRLAERGATTVRTARAQMRDVLGLLGQPHPAPAVTAVGADD